MVRNQDNLQADIQDRLEDAISDFSLIRITDDDAGPHLADEELFEHGPTADIVAADIRVT